MDFIKRAAQAKKPFYLIHAFAKVHFDNYPADGYQGRSVAKLPYRDAVVEVDDIVGRLTKTLEETGQAENTFVFFTSDNGPEEDSYPDSGFTPFRSGKGTTWEGVRVPGIAYWPGMIAAAPVTAFSISWICSTPRSRWEASRTKSRQNVTSTADAVPARR